MDAEIELSIMFDEEQSAGAKPQRARVEGALEGAEFTLLLGGAVDGVYRVAAAI